MAWALGAAGRPLPLHPQVLQAVLTPYQRQLGCQHPPDGHLWPRPGRARLGGLEAHDQPASHQLTSLGSSRPFPRWLLPPLRGPAPDPAVGLMRTRSSHAVMGRSPTRCPAPQGPEAFWELLSESPGHAGASEHLC
ncbi:uncharacterized protein LOC116158313 isoform X1 [Camelus dromedarius]|uniref:uncharacterized protein LOC116158313 isoform X1 n=1 Tax=Camelus dromedarius TaxID=9838 RepID=UPI00311A431E